MTAEIHLLPSRVAEADPHLRPEEELASQFLDLLDELERTDPALLCHVTLGGYAFANYLKDTEKRVHRIRRKVAAAAHPHSPWAWRG
jgi:uracil-DNA glycosylase